jgi:hypothetical protein
MSNPKAYSRTAFRAILGALHSRMLFMVIEHFAKNADEIGERFRQKGRMLPDGVQYVDSWIDAEQGRCFQIMQAPDLASLEEWIRRWDDIVTFEVTPVLTSAEYWAGRADRPKTAE